MTRSRVFFFFQCHPLSLSYFSNSLPFVIQTRGHTADSRLPSPLRCMRSFLLSGIVRTPRMDECSTIAKLCPFLHNAVQGDLAQGISEFFVARGSGEVFLLACTIIGEVGNCFFRVAGELHGWEILISIAAKGLHGGVRVSKPRFFFYFLFAYDNNDIFCVTASYTCVLRTRLHDTRYCCT